MFNLLAKEITEILHSLTSRIPRPHGTWPDMWIDLDSESSQHTINAMKEIYDSPPRGPQHCNHKIPLMFGSQLFSQLDLAAACCARRIVNASEFCDNAVTHRFTGEFHAPYFLGDIIIVNAIVVSTRYRSISIKVNAWREPAAKGTEVEEPKLIHVASADFVFVTTAGDKYVDHYIVVG